MLREKIGIVGGGTVGRATARAWLEFASEVRVYDIERARATHTLEEVMHCDLIFVCLPTPPSPFTGLDISALDKLFVDLNVSDFSRRTGYFVLKSTLPIGTTDRLARQWWHSSFVVSPEFLTARCADVDSAIPSQIVVGVPSFSQESMAGMVESAAKNKCCQLYMKLLYQRFPGTQIQLMMAQEAEMVKLSLNSLFAMKVAMFNELRQIADVFKLDWDRVRAGILGDGRLTAHHTLVPGPDGERGFGGTCLPKDLHCLRTLADRAGIRAFMMLAAELLNANVDRPRG